MDFDIHQLDGVDPGGDKAEEASGKYQDELIERFVDSPEGRARIEVAPELGYWAAQLIYYGWGYIGVTLPRMTVKDVEEIVTELFPRKISLPSRFGIEIPRENRTAIQRIDEQPRKVRDGEVFFHDGPVGRL